ncbi:Vegetative incompatibility HET-E-1-like protein [Cladobotryum mycophilum]|uniref:Vegetative incompatibility HET-E-1-like protein n=1 Tax=Cladobotryum mycophilum TaxID=491253 RepID=A0ABR0SYV9_9HYPO
MRGNPGNRDISNCSFGDHARVHQNNISVHSPPPISALGGLSEATFNSAGRQHEPRCLSDTRVEILSEIRTWADREDENRMFWLSGMAGTGKSTISLTVAQEYHNKKRLAASFFFTRDGGSLASTKHFAVTIAAQLAEVSPELRTHINASIKSNPRITGLGLYDQWEKLVLEPLARLNLGAFSEPYLLVVDALDECDNQDDIALLTQCLAATALNSIPLRVFITSRPYQHINYTFTRITPKAHDLILHVIEPSIINKDLEIYYQHNINKISQQLGLDDLVVTHETIQILVQQSQGLFIHAATAFAIEARKSLDQIYMTVLKYALETGLNTEEKDEIQRNFHPIVGSIVTTFDTMDLTTLTTLIKEPKANIIPLLDRLQSVLDVNTSEKTSRHIKVLHPSFRDFLLDPDRCTRTMFSINSKKAHCYLYNCCLRIMSEHLQRKNVCSLQRPGIRLVDVSRSDVDRHIPAVVQYACSYWIHHLKQSDVDPVQPDILDFFQTRFLFWTETLALIGRLSEGVAMVRLLDSLLSENDSSRGSLGRWEKITATFSRKSVDNVPSSLSAIVHDAKRFLLSHSSIIEEAPLQLYCSALIFSPRRSIIRQLYENQIPDWVLSAPYLRETWSPYLQFLHHSGVVLAVAFSPNGKLIASGCHDGQVYIWDAITGANQRIPLGHSDQIRSVLFSSDSKLVLLGSLDATIRLWNSATGKELLALQHTGSVLTAAFSPDSRLAVSLCLDGKVCMWDVSMGAEQWVVQETDPIRGIAFSPDGKEVAYGCGNKIQLLDSASGVRLGTLRGKLADQTISVDFSPDGRFIVSGTGNRIELWSAETRVKQRDMATGFLLFLKPAKNVIVKFSPNGKFIAAAIGEKIHLWDVASGAKSGEFSQPIEPFRRSDLTWYSMAFSHDGRFIAAGSADRMIRLWDAAIRTTGSSMIRAQQYWKSDISVSPDGKHTVFYYKNKCQLWDTQTGARLWVHKFKGLEYIKSVQFSPDTKVVAAVWEIDASAVWERSAAVCGWVLLDAQSGAVLHPRGWYLELRSGIIQFSPNSNIIATAWSAPFLNTITLSDVRSRKAMHRVELYTIKEDQIRCPHISFSPDSELLVCGDIRGVIQIWRAETGAVLHTLEDISTGISALRFSPNTNAFAVGSYGGTIILLDASAGWRIHNLEGHSGSVTAINFIRDGNVIASASEDMTVRVWDAATGATIHTINVNVPVYNMSPSSCNDHLITARGWIKKDTEDVIFLPPDYRKRIDFVAGTTIAFSVPQASTVKDVLGAPYRTFLRLNASKNLMRKAEREGIIPNELSS